MNTAGCVPISPVGKKSPDLLRIINRDLQDATRDISDDWRFGIAYNAALKLCTILLYAEGYRPEKTLQHFRTLQALPLILGNHRETDAKYLDTCRNKRNVAEYDYVGGVTEEDVNELIAFLKELHKDVIQWLSENHPEYLSGDS